MLYLNGGCKINCTDYIKININNVPFSIYKTYVFKDEKNKIIINLDPLNINEHDYRYITDQIMHSSIDEIEQAMEQYFECFMYYIFNKNGDLEELVNFYLLDKNIHFCIYICKYLFFNRNDYRTIFEKSDESLSKSFLKLFFNLKNDNYYINYLFCIKNKIFNKILFEKIFKYNKLKFLFSNGVNLEENKKEIIELINDNELILNLDKENKDILDIILFKLSLDCEEPKDGIVKIVTNNHLSLINIIRISDFINREDYRSFCLLIRKYYKENGNFLLYSLSTLKKNSKSYNNVLENIVITSTSFKYVDSVLPSILNDELIDTVCKLIDKRKVGVSRLREYLATENLLTRKIVKRLKENINDYPNISKKIKKLIINDNL